MNPTSHPLKGWQKVMGVVCRLFVAAIFAYAAWPKLRDPGLFAEAVYRYHLLPDALVNLVAIYLPWLEAVSALALIAIPRLRAGALAWCSALLLIFIFAMAVNLIRGVDITCGCFSVSGGEAMSWINIFRNIGLLALAGIAWRWDPATDPGAGAPRS
ncbi:MAG: DoxX family protein [Kiritimatiellae bacterium]|nr:DoxX family protein [Kiritimatiellia bacterium]MDW8457603.1 MauE/DoxX family redox-associated membrane protein [Verrucomicrobiota bacterium]